MGAAPAVLVAIPAVAWMYTEAVIAQRHLRLPPGSATTYSRGGSTLLDKRNEFVSQFLDQPQFSHLFFLDSDMTPEPDLVLRLLSHALPIVGALYFERVTPYGAGAGTRSGPDTVKSLAEIDGGVVRVAWHGTGALLIERSAMLAVPRPWFEWSKSRPGSGEDFYFTWKANEAGVPVYCDTGVRCGHLGITSIDLDYVVDWQGTARARDEIAAHKDFKARSAQREVRMPAGTA
jgi:hypothetical protein